MRFLELQDNNKERKKLRSKKLLKNWEDIEKVLNYQGFLYISKFIYSKLISRDYNNLLVSNFGIKKI